MKVYDFSKWGGSGSSVFLSPSSLKMNWEQIEMSLASLQSSLTSSRDLREILTTAARSNNPSFCIFNYDTPTEPREAKKISHLLPNLISSAVNAKNWLSLLPLLHEGEEGQIILLRSQVFSILANSFLSTWPLKKANFSCLLTGDPSDQQLRQEKLKCFLQYFHLASTNPQNSCISYERRKICGRIDWQSSALPLCNVVVHNSKIENLAGTSLIVDFANKHIGGGVLGRGSLQEEILFVTFPELLACRIFMGPLGNDEAVVVTGVTKYSNYSGYAQSFQFAEGVPFQKVTAQIAIIDALPYSKENSWNQYRLEDICRELKKCVAGFQLSLWESTVNYTPWGVTSGAWGCGDFGGDPHLKFLIQWAAVSYTGRPYLNMCLPGNSPFLREQVQHLANLYRGKSVANLFQDLRRYSQYNLANGRASKSVYEFLSQAPPNRSQSETSSSNHNHYHNTSGQTHSSSSSGNRKRGHPSSSNHQTTKRRVKKNHDSCFIL